MSNARIVAAAAALAAVLAAPACKSTQPTQGSKEVAVVTLTATAFNSVYDCWDTVSVFSAPPLPSVTTASVYCEQEFDDAGVLPVLRDAPIAFSYSASISIIPAGKVTETVVASSSPVSGDVPAGFPTFGSLTDFDPAVAPGPASPSHAPPPPANTTVTYSNPRQVSKGSRLYAQFANLHFPEPNILHKVGGFPVEIHKGDTIIVRARKIDLGSAQQNFQTNQDLKLTLDGGLSIDGIPVLANGITTSPTLDQAGVAYSLTVR